MKGEFSCDMSERQARGIYLKVKESLLSRQVVEHDIYTPQQLTFQTRQRKM
ncbi:13321_t:CDS:1, partial [Ambispora leptoticha]